MNSQVLTSFDCHNLLIRRLCGNGIPLFAVQCLGFVREPRKEQVLVLMALGTLTSEEIRRLGFHVIARPAGVDRIIAAASSLLKATTS